MSSGGDGQSIAEWDEGPELPAAKPKASSKAHPKAENPEPAAPRAVARNPEAATPPTKGLLPLGNGFLSPDPYPLDVESASWVSFPHGVQEDIVSGAPQRLFRYLKDALRTLGCRTAGDREPVIEGQSIRDTGSTRGWALAERNLMEVGGIYPILRGAGVALIVASLAVVPGFLLPFLALDVAGGVLYAIAFAFLLGGGIFLVRMHMFQSEIFYVRVRGEVYRSSLRVGTRLPTQVSDSERVSLVSELRVSLYSAGVRTRNVAVAQRPAGQGKAYLRVVEAVSPSPSARAGLRQLVQEFQKDILPRVVLQKSQELEAKEPGAAPLGSPGPVAPPRVVRCAKCDTMNPAGARYCSDCGESLR